MKGRRHIYSMDFYAFRSGLLGADPGFKLFFSLFVLALCIWGDNDAVSFFVIVSMALLNIGKNRVSIRDYFTLLAIPGAFIFMGCCALMLDVGYREGRWLVSVNRGSFQLGIHVMLRSFGSVSALSFLTLSTPVGEVISALGRLHVPGIVTELMYLIYRYIFIMADSHSRIRAAAESRLGFGDFKTSCRTFGASLGNLLVFTLKRSGDCYHAMESRGYEGELLFMEEERQFKAAWLLWAFLYGAVIAVIKAGTERGVWL